MANSRDKQIKAQAIRKTKIETTYEYVPIIGEILGFWRKSNVAMAGEAIELHINTPIEEWDRIVINGQDFTEEFHKGRTHNQ